MQPIRKASKKKTKLRGALYALSGGGKTYGALRVATGLVRAESPNGTIPPFPEKGRIGFICSEDGDGELYADRFDYDVIVLENKTIADYLDAIRAFAAAGVGVLIIDSLSHAWRELLEQVDRAKKDNRGNSFAGWADATPLQKEFVETIKKFPGHVIATMRADTLWDLEADDRGKKTPKRIGMKPEQGKGIEYEFSFLIAINADHSAVVEKDRTGKFQDARIPLLDEAFGAQLAEWLASGVKPVTAEQKAEMKQLCRSNGLNAAGFAALCGPVPDTFEAAEDAIAKLKTASPTAKREAEMAAKADELAAITQGGAAPTSPLKATPAQEPAGGASTTTKPASRSAETRASRSAEAHSDSSPIESPSFASDADDDGVVDDEDEPREQETSTTLLLSFKRACDTSRTAPELGSTIAAWRPRLGALSARPALVANTYAAARLKEIEGSDLSDDEARIVTSLNNIAKE